MAGPRGDDAMRCDLCSALHAMPRDAMLRDARAGLLERPRCDARRYHATGDARRYHAGWLAGWLAGGWLAGWWLAGWLVAGWPAGWLAGWLVAGCHPPMGSPMLSDATRCWPAEPLPVAMRCGAICSPLGRRCDAMAMGCPRRCQAMRCAAMPCLRRWRSVAMPRDDGPMSDFRRYAG